MPQTSSTDKPCTSTRSFKGLQHFDSNINTLTYWDVGVQCDYMYLVGWLYLFKVVPNIGNTASLHKDDFYFTSSPHPGTLCRQRTCTVSHSDWRYSLRRSQDSHLQSQKNPYRVRVYQYIMHMRRPLLSSFFFALSAFGFASVTPVVLLARSEFAYAFGISRMDDHSESAKQSVSSASATSVELLELSVLDMQEQMNTLSAEVRTS